MLDAAFSMARRYGRIIARGPGAPDSNGLHRQDFQRDPGRAASATMRLSNSPRSFLRKGVLLVRHRRPRASRELRGDPFVAPSLRPISWMEADSPRPRRVKTSPPLPQVSAGCVAGGTMALGIELADDPRPSPSRDRCSSPPPHHERYILRPPHAKGLQEGLLPAARTHDLLVPEDAGTDRLRWAPVSALRP